jgi:hypothetical protein
MEGDGMKLTANCDVIMGDGTRRIEPFEVHVNPDYITQAWRTGDSGVVYMRGHEDSLRLDAKSFAKVVKWLSGKDVYDMEVRA